MLHILCDKLNTGSIGGTEVDLVNILNDTGALNAKETAPSNIGQ
jgi:hypothetical protein